MSIADFLLRRFRPTHDPTGLGRLEQEVMQVLWRRTDTAAPGPSATPPASVRAVQAELGQAAAYTTVMTTLDRLYRKGLLTRSRAGRAYVYRAALTRAELERGLAAHVVRGLLDAGRTDARPILSSIVDAVSERDRALLDELERLVRARRERDRERR